MEAFLGGTTEMQIELDSGTAGIPWELLDTDTGAGGEPRPWAIRAKLLRKLRTDGLPPAVVDADADAQRAGHRRAGLRPDSYPRLSGARDEARAVAARLKEAGGARMAAGDGADQPG